MSQSMEERAEEYLNSFAWTTFRTAEEDVSGLVALLREVRRETEEMLDPFIEHGPDCKYTPDGEDTGRKDHAGNPIRWRCVCGLSAVRALISSEEVRRG